MKNRYLPRVLFWAFCCVVFSKIAWYDFRVYLPEESRRTFMTTCFAFWVLGQLLIYLFALKPMLRQINRVAIFWGLAVTPYLILGLLEGRVNMFLIADVVRYSLPLGYLLFSLWAVKTVPVRTILVAMSVTLTAWIMLRTVLHWTLAEGTLIRYGVHWEAALPSLLVAFALVARRWRYFTLLLALAVTVLAVVAGQTRAVVFGMAIAGGIIGLYALWRLRFQPSSGVRLGIAAGIVVLLTLTPMIVPNEIFERVHVLDVIVDTNAKVLPRAPRDVASIPDPSPMIGSDGESILEESQIRNPASPEPAAQESTHAEPPTKLIPGSANSSPETVPAPVTTDKAPHLEDMLQRWEKAIAEGGRSLDVRIFEAQYFLALLGNDLETFLLGVGAGSYFTVTTPDHERIVRGAHNTYITLLFRHGIILGLLLSWLVTFYGLPTNIRQLYSSAPKEWAVLLIALIAYRFAAIGMAQLHQGLFDDPLVFLSMAIALALPRGETTR